MSNTRLRRSLHELRTLPPLAQRLAAGRPVMTREQLTDLGHRVLRMTTLDGISVQVEHTVRIITRMANDRVLSSDDGDTLSIRMAAGSYPTVVNFITNQLDDSVLTACVHQCEQLIKTSSWYNKDPGMSEWLNREVRLQDSTVPVHLWHDATVDAMTTSRGTVIPELLHAVQDAQLQAAGFLGLMARAEAVVSKDNGILYTSEETDSEVTVTARSRDGKRSGWGGQAARDWSTVDYRKAAHRAIEMTTLCGPPEAVEPGRRTAILAPAASIQILAYLADEFDAWRTDHGLTALSDPVHRNKIKQRIVDPRLTMTSDPADPEGGYRPYFDPGHGGLATPPMTWINNGVLTNLAYDQGYAMERGKAYADQPRSLRLSGGTTTIDEMIASCKEGIYVNRFSNVRMVHQKSGLTTGVTRDGCFFIKDGKLTKAVKNFRFLESPFFFLNKVIALGKPERAAFGYTPPARNQIGIWPLPPIIAPPMMVQDFNFSALSDFV